MEKDVKFYCESCLSCNQHRKSLKKAPVQQMPLVEIPYQRVGLDVLGPLPITDQGNSTSCCVYRLFNKKRGGISST